MLKPPSSYFFASDAALVRRVDLNRKNAATKTMGGLGKRDEEARLHYPGKESSGGPHSIFIRQPMKYWLIWFVYIRVAKKKKEAPSSPTALALICQ